MIHILKTLFAVCLFCSLAEVLPAEERPSLLDVTDAVVVIQPDGNHASAELLVDEVHARTGLRWKQTTDWPEQKTIIALTSDSSPSAEAAATKDHRAKSPESYHIQVQRRDSGQTVVWVAGHDDRGLLFGVGALLRNLRWSAGKAELPASLDLAVSPAYPIRGHQIGYRARANSWDAWTIEQFEQFFRDLAVFGTNAIENIPFQDPRQNSMMKYSRRDMNRLQSEICEKYDLDYWVWTPADFDLSDEPLRAEMFRRHVELYNDCPRLDGVFFPAGDPGENAPELVLPFLEEIAGPLRKAHPEAKIWMSLQLLSDEEEDYVFAYIRNEQPEWLGGLVCGPSSMPIPEIRDRLPEQYQFRLYPDITHNKLCQYVVPNWDPAFANTLGREAINPRPVEYARIHNLFAPYSDGFLSYTDGVHDDVNKIIFSMRGVDPNHGVREILIEYCRYFFDPAIAEEAADGILALENNWHGPLEENGAVEATLKLWQDLEKRAPQLKKNWRWQMNLLRAYFDAYTRRRLVYETKLAEEANEILLQAETIGADAAMTEALATLNRTRTAPVAPKLRTRIEELCAALFESIGLQTSVPVYGASGAERGAFLDFIDYPLNNRWWYEDEFAALKQLDEEAAKLARLHTIATWENPGPGSFYDDIGHPGKSPHVLDFVPGDSDTAMQVYTKPATTHWWINDGEFRGRNSWLTTMSRIKVAYEGLDPDASYTVRVAGYGKSLLRADGELLEPTVDNRGLGEFKEFPVPPAMLRDRKLVLSWDRPTDEGDLNWRERSRNAEVWLLKASDSE